MACPGIRKEGCSHPLLFGCNGRPSSDWVINSPAFERTRGSVAVRAYPWARVEEIHLIHVRHLTE